MLAESWIHEEQCCFYPDGGKVDQVFTLARLQEWARQFAQPVEKVHRLV